MEGAAGVSLRYLRVGITSRHGFSIRYDRSVGISTPSFVDSERRL